MSEAKIKSLFGAYSSDGTHNGKITDEGIEKFMNDIGLSLEQLECLTIGYKMGADTMGKFTYDQFKKGCTDMGADTLQKRQAAVPQLKSSWKKDEALYKKVYMFAFEVNREPGMNNLETDTAVALWPMFMSDRCQFLDKWLDFIENSLKPNVIKKD